MIQLVGNSDELYPLSNLIKEYKLVVPGAHAIVINHLFGLATTRVGTTHFKKWYVAYLKEKISRCYYLIAIGIN